MSQISTNIALTQSYPPLKVWDQIFSDVEFDKGNMCQKVSQNMKEFGLYLKMIITESVRYIAHSSIKRPPPTFLDRTFNAHPIRNFQLLMYNTTIYIEFMHVMRFNKNFQGVVSNYFFSSTYFVVSWLPILFSQDFKSYVLSGFVKVLVLFIKTYFFIL